jgi:hypothetical protein
LAQGQDAGELAPTASVDGAPAEFLHIAAMLYCSEDEEFFNENFF